MWLGHIDIKTILEYLSATATGKGLCCVSVCVATLELRQPDDICHDIQHKKRAKFPEISYFQNKIFFMYS